MKFILRNNIIKFLMVLFFLTSTLTLNIKRTNSKALPANFDATLTITNHSKKSSESVEISLNKESLTKLSSGIQVTLRDTTKKIASLAFISSGNGVYFVPFRAFASSIDCTSSSWVYFKNGLTFYVNNSNESISFSLTFPKKFLQLFGNTINDKDAGELCTTISANISKYFADAKNIRSKITANINAAAALESERNANIKSKEDMKKFLDEQEKKVKEMLESRTALETQKAKTDSELVEIEATKTLKLKQIQGLENDMLALDDRVLAIEKTKEEKSKATTFKEIAEADVNALYEKVKAELANLVKLHSDKDPAAKDITTLSADVKANKDKIIQSFKN